MLLRLLKYNTTAGYLLIPLLVVIAWFPAFASGSWQQMAYDLNPMPLYELLIRYIDQDSTYSAVISMVLVILIGFSLIRFNSKYLFLRERTLLPAFLFIMIATSISSLHRLHPALIAALFFLAALSRLLSSYKAERLSYNYFEASFLIATGSLFYFNLIYFIILVWLALLILRPVIWREWVFSILGLTIPWAFFAFTDFFMHDSLEWSRSLISINFTTTGVLSLISLPEKIFFSLLLLLIILASKNISGAMPTMKILARKVFYLFFWVFLLAVLVFTLAESANIEITVIAAMPVSFLLSNYILSIRQKFWSNVILWLILAGVLILTWIPWLETAGVLSMPWLP